MEERDFVFEKTVYLTDTNLFGNVYFARYFDWQGMAREAFFKQMVGDFSAFMRKGIKFVTIKASISYHHETVAFDEVIIKVRPENLKVTTVELVFTYINKKTGVLVAEGRQKIGFVDRLAKVIPIPGEIINGR